MRPGKYAPAGCNLASGPEGLLPEELAARLQQMARLRNLLVHMYWKIDYGHVFDILHRNLDDLRAFAGAVLRLL